MPSAARELPEGYWEPVVTENTQSANTCGVDNGAGVHTETRGQWWAAEIQMRKKSLKPKMWGLNFTKVARIFKGFGSRLLI